MVNIHIQAEEDSVQHLLSQLKEDGQEVSYQYDSKGRFLHAVLEVRIFIGHTTHKRALYIHDPTYSQTYFKIESEE